MPLDGMARTRNLKPAFFTNEQLGELDPLVRLLFAGLWTHADREGRLEDRPKRIKVLILPFDECDVDSMLDQLAAGDDPFIYRYESDGHRVLQIVHWQQHQSPHGKEPDSVLPSFAGTCLVTAGEKLGKNATGTSFAGESKTQLVPERSGTRKGNPVKECKVKECEVKAKAQGGVQGGKDRKAKFEPSDFETARWIFSLIRELQEDRREPDFEAWANDIRLMRERDGRTDSQIRSLFGWANRDTFWRVNILSPGKLREKWDDLVLRRNGASRSREDPRGTASIVKSFIQKERTKEDEQVHGIGGD